MAAAKPNIKVKALEALLLLFEVSENFDSDTMDTLEALIKNKNVKVSENLPTNPNFLQIIGLTYSAICSLMSAYGPSKFKP